MSSAAETAVDRKIAEELAKRVIEGPAQFNQWRGEIYA
jgi:hypothetical protein